MTEYAAGGFTAGPVRDGVLIPRRVVMEMGAKALEKLKSDKT